MSSEYVIRMNEYQDISLIIEPLRALGFNVSRSDTSGAVLSKSSNPLPETDKWGFPIELLIESDQIRLTINTGGARAIINSVEANLNSKGIKFCILEP